MVQDDLSDLQTRARADALVRTIEQFVRTLNDRAGEDHAADVILDGATLDGNIIRQKPERFIEEELVGPVLDALGYEYRFQPTGFDGLGDQIPDFTATNLDVTNFGEVKVPGEIVNARRESFDYLGRATTRPLVGIATDGFSWILHSAEEPGEGPQYQYHAVLRDVVKKIRLEQVHSTAERRSRQGLREAVHKFICDFSRESVTV